ncbi:MAG: hypothetical protein Q7T33_16270 [Dehalococcoidia bacterium]|nr:hypothetical protein [Dehalococcoidia bacterium]
MKTLIVLLALAVVGLVSACGGGPPGSPAGPVSRAPTRAAESPADVCNFEPHSFLPSPIAGARPDLGSTPYPPISLSMPSILAALADGSAPKLIGSGQSPVWSPDGTRIAFTTNIRGGLGGMFDIAVSDVETTSSRTVARATWSDTDLAGPLAWSPDGCFVAFEDLGYGYVVRADGSEPPLPIFSGSITSWSPTEDVIAFPESGSLRVHLLELDTGVQRPLPAFRLVIWSRDGERVLYEDSATTSRDKTDFYVLDVNADEPRLVYSHPGLAPLNGVEEAAWSPDGTRIALLVPTSGPPCPEPGRTWGSDCNPSDVTVIDVSGAAAAVVVGQGSWPVKWSPDGASVVFHRIEGEEAWFFAAPADGSAQARMFLQAWDLSWSPAGDRLLLVR